MDTPIGSCKRRKSWERAVLSGLGTSGIKVGPRLEQMFTKVVAMGETSMVLVINEPTV